MKVYFSAKYEHPSGTSIQFQSDWAEDNQALLFIADFEKTGRFSEVIVHDDLDQQWSVKEFKKLMTKATGAAKDLTVYFDAAYSKTDQSAGLGWMIEYRRDHESYTEKRNKLLHDVQSNNEAEYAALYYAIHHAIEIAAGHQQLIRCYGDALTVTNQMSGEWPCYDQDLTNWADKIDLLLTDHGMTAEYVHIGRNHNKSAHKLAHQAMNDTNIKSLNRNDKDE
ncbi:reverse transcriptase-like protein [Jeotgalibacillus haloalkalitolerans]|uniref:Reverse transcriptase-like protein n=1 Tax=Jeotgalibacillus haloalkalitolerans TaxID=3104292 RepID=A0ABU5KMM6_9BACL|nr:reverse transcriptase-like protein [Jeotgalibacillus sp. HH7-29]MDZ5711960.1 reverse transcriptase-like protein [Jeotgalibacillus sp. HH7-29]